ncbi:MAG: hypothetical protein IPM38_05615 [Ignavibacteria bacterium]|nr:hypothetical protein [Ignavibacteria bacterium]
MKLITDYPDEKLRLKYTVTSTFGPGYFYAGLYVKFIDTSFFKFPFKEEVMATAHTAEIPDLLSSPAKSV